MADLGGYQLATDLATWLARQLDGEAVGSSVRFPYRGSSYQAFIPPNEWARLIDSYESDGALIWPETPSRLAAFQLVYTHLIEVLDTRGADSHSFEFRDGWFFPAPV